MEQKREYKRCNVCAQGIRWNSFAAHLRSNNPQLKTGVKIKRGVSKLVPNSGHDYDNQLLTEGHLARAVLAATLQNEVLQASNTDFIENVSENH